MKNKVLKELEAIESNNSGWIRRCFRSAGIQEEDEQAFYDNRNNRPLAGDYPTQQELMDDVHFYLGRISALGQAIDLLKRKKY